MSMIAARARAERRKADGGFADRAEEALVPARSIAGRSLVVVVAIMTFLAGLAAGVGVIVLDASAGWRGQAASEATIQVPPAAGRDGEADVAALAKLAAAAKGVAAARVETPAQSAALLSPWLGPGLDLAGLPVPRLIEVKLAGATPEDLAALGAAAAKAVPGASLDDHRVWLARLTAAADSVIALTVFVLALVVAATLLAVGFATRGAMAGNAEIISVLHLVGAQDRFVAAQFQRHFLRLGLRGAALGGAAALAVFLFGGAGVGYRDAGAIDPTAGLAGAASLGWTGVAAIVAAAAAMGALTGALSRAIVMRHLRGLGA
ncbi:MAG: ABC transporter permease [Hyphomicrobiales bacterium]|nr:ABC transporter permease [Hyphomicrobiales bacterium]